MADPRPNRKLTAKQRAFCEEYLKDLNATQAVLRAGYKTKYPDKMGSELLGNSRVKAYLDKRMRKRQERTEITQDMVLKRWWDIANADPNDLIGVRRLCCRHCYGKDYEYQWRDEKEYKRAVKRVIESTPKDEEPLIPSIAGGYGYERLEEPNPDCPYCWGEGHAESFIKDTRDLPEGARQLYAGIKQTANGIEVKFRDQDKALENVARHLGMFNDKMEVNVTVDKKLEDFL